MNLYEYVIEATSQQYAQEIGSHPIFATLKQGALQRETYLAYLRETCHLIRHTTSILARAASYLPDEHRVLRGWLVEQAIDEHNHDLLCWKDMEALGADPKEQLARTPLQGAWGLITQSFHVAQHDPVAILGYVLTTEGIGADYASTYADVLVQQYGYKSNQVTFIRAHGGFDVKHVEEARKIMNSLDADERTRDAILAVRRFSITYYARMLQDALDAPKPGVATR